MKTWSVTLRLTAERTVIVETDTPELIGVALKARDEHSRVAACHFPDTSDLWENPRIDAVHIGHASPHERRPKTT